MLLATPELLSAAVGRRPKLRCLGDFGCKNVRDLGLLSEEPAGGDEVNRWRPFGTQRFERDLHDELSDHYRRLVEDHLRMGLTEVEARRRAAVSLGGWNQTNEACREQARGPCVGSIGQDIRIAFRSLRGTTWSQSWLCCRWRSILIAANTADLRRGHAQSAPPVVGRRRRANAWMP
jgi:hypothetical protein